MRALLIHSILFSYLLYQTLPQANSLPNLVKLEVNALKEIAATLGKKNWNFTVDPCSKQGNWSPVHSPKGSEKIIECDCSFKKNTTCHVITLWLKGQNLSGSLPPDLYKLRFLESLDLSRNILSGSIPSQWTGMRIRDLSVMGNQLSGPFPQVITNITTLRNLSIEANQFFGPLPPELGNLIRLEKLVISSNQFNGQLPKTLAKLTNLTDLRINDNKFSGKIPEFISNWTLMEKLHIQGSSFEGPIPESISALTSLSDLRISDLSGSGSGFPHLDEGITIS